MLRISGPAKPGDELPDLDRQLGLGARPADRRRPATTSPVSLASDPARSVARLVCPRVLTPDTSYLACVVPTFELGPQGRTRPRRTPPRTRRKLEPAWTQAAPAVELPVYHSWTFSTGAGGDFQSLALLLRARPLPDGIGEIEIDVGESGLRSDVPSGTTLPLRGALQPVGATPKSWSDRRAADRRGSRRSRRS